MFVEQDTIIHGSRFKVEIKTQGFLYQKRKRKTTENNWSEEGKKFHFEIGLTRSSLNLVPTWPETKEKQ